MELKQLEYFAAAADSGSLSKAAENLYTSQPNISKVIKGLEKELDCELFHRSSKGICLTKDGEQLYQYAKTILNNASLMLARAKGAPVEKFSISCYPSHMISRIFCEHFNEEREKNISMDFLEGTLEEIAGHVGEYRSEIGIVFYSHYQKPYIQHLISHKNLEFTTLANKSICVYAGRHSDLFSKESVSFDQLCKYQFVQSSADFFSMEQQLEMFSADGFRPEQFQAVVSTNCDNLLIDMLLHTDLCNLGIYFMIPDYDQYGIRAIPIKDCDNCLTLGYLKRRDASLSRHAEYFIERLTEVLLNLE